METLKTGLRMDRAHRAIAPRIVYIITTVDREGRVNAGCFCNLTSVSTNPQRIAFSTVGKWDTYRNVKSTRQFVVNVPPRELLEEVWIIGDKYSGTPIPTGIDEVQIAGLTEVPSEKVRPPRIRECFAHLECKVVWIKNVGDHFLILGEILAASCDEEAFDSEFVQQVERTRPLMQVSGPIFATATEMMRVDQRKVRERVLQRLEDDSAKRCKHGL